MTLSNEPVTAVGVLDKAMLVLSAFSRGEQALLPRQIAVKTGLTMPTVYRLGQALCEHGLLEKEGPRFRLGMRLMRLGALVAEGIDIRRQILPVMKVLNEQSNEHIELQVRRGSSRIAIEVLHSTHYLRPFSDVGNPMPLHVGAAGRTLLAWLPNEQSSLLAEQSAAQFPQHGTLDVETFQRHLALTRQRGWSVSDGERAPGLAALAVPIWDSTGAVAAALILASISTRMTFTSIEEWLPLLQRAAAEASRKIGYESEDAVALP